MPPKMRPKHLMTVTSSDGTPLVPASPFVHVTPLQSYFVPLQKRFGTRARNTLYNAICGLFFLERVEHKNVAVWLVAFHYLPVLAMIMTVALTCLLHVLISLVNPLLRAPGSLVCLPVVAHGGIFLGISVLAYKLMCVVLDCVVDSCLYVEDPQTKTLVPFYQLLHDLRTIGASRWSIAVTLLSIMAIPLIAWEVLLRDVFSMRWSRGDATMFHYCTCLFLFAGLYLLVSFVRNVLNRSPGERFDWLQVVRWWATTIPRVRRRCAYAIICGACYTFLAGGGSEGMVSFSEGMIYLATPHLFLNLAVRLTLFEQNLRSFFLATVHQQCNSPMVLVLVPYLLMLASSFVYVGAKPVFWIECAPLLVMMVTVRKMYSNDKGAGSVRRLSLALYFCNTKQLQRKLPHYRAGILVRFALRVMLGLALILVGTLGIWISLQQQGIFMGEAPASFVSLSAEHARVRTSFMEVNLVGLPEGASIDPDALVFEEHSYLYDPSRYNALCSKIWFQELHAADLGYFSLMAYLSPQSADFLDSFEFYKKHRVGGGQWEYLMHAEKDSTSHGVVFHHFRSAKAQISVLAVRGTALGSPNDFLQNFLIFGETAIFQILAAVVPFGGFLSDRVKADVFAFSSRVSATLFGENVDLPHPESSYFHLQLESYIAQHVAKDDRLVLTGHSLGGVVSQIVAARKRVPALAFSSPGIGLMYKKFGVSPDSIDAYTSNVVASNDIIPLIDRLSGTVHHIQCEHTRAQICHSIELHTIRMWSMCSSYRSLVLVNGSYTITPQPHEEVFTSIWNGVSRAWRLLS